MSNKPPKSNLQPGPAKTKIAEISIEADGKPSITFPRNVSLRQLEFAMMNLTATVIEMRVKAEMLAQNQRPVINPHTGKPILRDRT